MTLGHFKYVELDALLLQCGGLKGLAEQLGQDDPNAEELDGRNHDNEPREHLGLWRRILARISPGSGD
jgi:hypothetical protein